MGTATCNSTSRPPVRPRPAAKELIDRLCDGILEQDVGAVVAAIATDVDVRSGCPVGNTPLGLAVANANVSITRLLLNAGADPNSFASMGIGGEFPVLFSAVATNMPAVVVTLLEAGANPDARGGEDAWTPLAYAAYWNRQDVCEPLARAGAEVDAWVDFPNIGIECNLLADEPRCHMTPLMIAAWRGHVEVLTTLVANGADPNLRSQEGLTAFDYARRFRSPIPLILRGLEASPKLRARPGGQQ